MKAGIEPNDYLKLFNYIMLTVLGFFILLLGTKLLSSGIELSLVFAYIGGAVLTTGSIMTLLKILEIKDIMKLNFSTVNK